jgi:LacI family transcriptional regulator
VEFSMRPTLDDVAKRAGVSPSTVSRTLSGNIKVSSEKQQRVWQAAKELGYQPDGVARGLRSGYTRILGLVVPDIRNPFFADIIRGAEDVAAEHKYTLFVGSTDEDRNREKTHLQALISHRPAGLMVSSSRAEEVLSQVSRHQIPIVLLGRGRTTVTPNWVGTDHRLGASLAARHLLGLRHKRLAVISGPTDIDVYELRREGFLAEIGAHCEDVMVQAGYRGVQGGYMAMQELLASRRACPSGVFAASDTLAIGAIRAVIEAGLLVPDDVSVIGFDGLELGAYITPRLTTVSQSGYQIGYLGCRRLLALVQGNDAEEHQPIMLKPTLVVRESTAPPREAMQSADK